MDCVYRYIYTNVYTHAMHAFCTKAHVRILHRSGVTIMTRVNIYITLLTSHFYSTKILEDLLGTLKILKKEVNQLPTSCCIEQNLFE